MRNVIIIFIHYRDLAGDEDARGEELFTRRAFLSAARRGGKIFGLICHFEPVACRREIRFFSNRNANFTGDQYSFADTRIVRGRTTPPTPTPRTDQPAGLRCTRRDFLAVQNATLSVPSSANLSVSSFSEILNPLPAKLEMGW